MPKYQQIMHDAARPMEMQLYLVTAEANELSSAVLDLLRELEARHSSAPTDGIKHLMQSMNRRITETDIFMAGYKAGEDK